MTGTALARVARRKIELLIPESRHLAQTLRRLIQPGPLPLMSLAAGTRLGRYEIRSFERAAQLFGAAEALREAIGSPLPVIEQADYERSVRLTREGLNEETFAELWAEGREMTLESAVAYALKSQHDA